MDTQAPLNWESLIQCLERNLGICILMSMPGDSGEEQIEEHLNDSRNF